MIMPSEIIGISIMVNYWNKVKHVIENKNKHNN